MRRRSQEPELSQLTPQRHGVLAPGRNPRLKMGEVRIQNAATGCLGGALRETLGLGELADRPAGQPHATADAEQRLAGCMPAPDFLIESLPPDPAIGTGRPLGPATREGAGASRRARLPTRDRRETPEPAMRPGQPALDHLPQVQVAARPRCCWVKSEGSDGRLT